MVTSVVAFLAVPAGGSATLIPIMGLVKRGDVWWLRVMIDGRRFERSTKFTDAKLARRRAVEIENELRSGELGWTKDCPTFAEWWKTYEKTYAPLKRERTQARDRGNIVHATPIFGAKRLDAIKPSDCESYLQQRREAKQANPRRKNPKPISEGTVQRERRFLAAVFQRAVDDGIIDSNPWAGIKGKRDKVRARLLTPDNETKLLAVLSPRFQRFVTFMLQTGLRLDECRGIKPETDIHDDHVRVLGKFRKYRDMPLTALAQQTIKDQLDADGKLWTQNPQRLREVLAEGAQRAKIPHISPHDLRHTFGWRWIQAGGDVYILSKLLGHATITVTERNYAHALKADISATVRRVMEGAG